MLEHSNVIWGDFCSCGNVCFILQNKFHPWVDNDFFVTMNCPKCGNDLVINREKAAKLYNQKIYAYYSGITGTVVDLGCGGGFLSQYLNEFEDVKKIYALDIDKECESIITRIGEKVEFINTDLIHLNDVLENKEIDYLVHRDVFMFVENTTKYFDDVTRIVKKGIRHMGWFLSNNERMKNQLLPEEIKEELEVRGWKVELEYLNWYKCGYFIKADK